MDPVTMGAIALGSTVLGTVVQAHGQSQAAAASAANSRYQAQVNANNAIVAGQNARYATEAGRVAGQSQDLRTRALLGQQEAAQSASGIDLTSGSPLAVRESTRQLGRLDTLSTVQKSNLDAYGYQAQATGFEAEAGLEKQKAGYAEQAGRTAVLGTILGGASSFASKWNAFRNVGVDFSGGI